MPFLSKDAESLLRILLKSVSDDGRVAVEEIFENEVQNLPAAKRELNATGMTNSAECYAPYCVSATITAKGRGYFL